MVWFWQRKVLLPLLCLHCTISIWKPSWHLFHIPPSLCLLIQYRLAHFKTSSSFYQSTSRRTYSLKPFCSAFRRFLTASLLARLTRVSRYPNSNTKMQVVHREVVPPRSRLLDRSQVWSYTSGSYSGLGCSYGHSLFVTANSLMRSVQTRL